MAQMPLLTSFFLGLGWPWVGEFDGFIIIVTCFPTQQNLVYIPNTLLLLPVLITATYLITPPALEPFAKM